ncbi:MerR family DNA-binding transcriptional regulator [candidate division TA06 bacterium]|nr:MerR family DNA-binding transcriptional regulator [candidate division TA06 bacterium]
MNYQKQVTRVEIIEVPERFYFKVSKASHYLGISPNSLRAYTDLGLIRAKILPGGHRLYRKDWLDEFVERLPDALDLKKRRN